MKKITTLLITLLCVLGASAQNEMSIVPTEVKESGTYFNLELNNPETESQIICMEFSIKWPVGWTVSKCSTLTSSALKSRYAYEEDDEEEGKITKTPWTIDQSEQSEDGTIKYSVSGGNTYPLQGKSGAIARFKLTPPAGTPAGAYVVEVCEGSWIAKNFIAGSEIYVPKSQSFVYVGEAKDVTFAPEGVMTSIVTNNLPEWVKVDLSAVTTLRGKSNDTVDATYKRTVTNQWNTICLPFGVNSDNALQFYSVTKIGDDALEVKQEQHVDAGTPVLLRISEKGEQVIEFSNSGIDATVNNTGNMIGTFERITVKDEGTYYIKNEQFWEINESFNVGAFKAYLATGTKTAKSNVLDINLDESTAINAANIDLNAIEEVYGLNGTRQNSLQKGVNMVKIGDKVMKVVVK